MKKLNHLSEISDFYDAYIIDLWGVMHNGIKLNQSAIKVTENLLKKNKKISFLSNAPRPKKNVANFLKKMGMSDKYLSFIFTSGDASMKAISNETYGKKFYHLGPERDCSLFIDLKKNRTAIMNCDYILCTGLFDEKEKDLEYYSNLLKKHTSKKMICTNPDLIVHRGNELEYCAGKIASIFENLGGEVIYFGKPHKEIYKPLINKNEKTLIIGDNLRTDIKGANNIGLDSIFIINGVHRKEVSDFKNINFLEKKYNIKLTYVQLELEW